ncbi:hypothetical protein LPJ76_004537 [Coemansia sp. RSA 638]|nr:hypothetical protein LPJ76_004537 [Coemansia sp. RSA 638]
MSHATTYGRTVLRAPAKATECTTLAWSNTFTRELPGDAAVEEAPYAILEKEKSGEQTVDIPEVLFRASREVRGLWSWAVAEQHENPQLVSVSPSGAQLVGLSASAFWRDADTAAMAWSGSTRLAGSNMWAHNYGGHQFGIWAGQLGDGRAMSLGETVHNSCRWEVQLKGAGPTPYVRMADGYAVRRSSIREYLAAEHMHALGVPTARSLSLVFTDREVVREERERGAVVARLAPSWVRFGSFELPASRADHVTTKQLADYVIRHHYPDITHNPYIQLLERAVASTAQMVARWQAVGFCHGVMNTDYMSLLGLTIDYGPFAFLDAYDPDFICNHSDPSGRYAFNEQPRVALWNLTRLAAPLAALINQSADPSGSEQTVNVITDALNAFGPQFSAEYARVMRRKFGLFAVARDDDVDVVVQPFLDLLAEAGTDYAFAMRTLCSVPEALSSNTLDAVVDGLALRSQTIACDVTAWKRRVSEYFTTVYGPRLERESADATVGERMKRENPNFVLRNWVAQDIIARADKGDFAWVDQVLKLLTVHAFDDHAPAGMEDAEKYAGPVPDWGEGLQCSCSS